MSLNPFVLVAPGATRGLGVALTRQFLRTTNLPVYASHRAAASDDSIKKRILEPLGREIDPARLTLLKLDLTSEDSIAGAAQSLSESLEQKNLSNAFIHTAFITGGVLVPEKKPADLDWDTLKETFQINVISHLLIIKHFSRFLPPSGMHAQSQTGQSKDINGDSLPYLAKWAHVSARLGSIQDNERGGWYSYRSSKAALNQVIKTFDLYLQQHHTQAMCVGVHPGTVKTDLSRAFWASTRRRELFEPMDAAANLIDVVENLNTHQRGKVWDWSGKEVPW
jgi:NAD(P)-dependent dehydrogenase (short-subunit alcohol dehydrogenase family)